MNIPTFRTSEPFDVHALEACDAGITGCDALVAQAGTALVTGCSAGGRALSVLPPHHAVLARRGQIVADLPAASELLKAKSTGNYFGMISIITGPSRTGGHRTHSCSGRAWLEETDLFCSLKRAA